MIKVLLIYIVYPLAMGTYFRKALEHRPDVDLKVAGVYTGNWIPWTDANNPTGMSLPMKYAKPPDVDLPFPPNIGEYNYEVIKAKLDDWVPDLIIQVDANLHCKYKPSSGFVVTVGTDPHVLNDFYETPRKYSDIFFNMQATYSRPGDHYLPYAYSTYDFYPNITYINTFTNPQNYQDPKDTDAVLVGNTYLNRVQWVEELRKRGVSVIFELGPVFDEARALYNRGRIGLNWSTMDDLNCRAFELPAMRLCPVMNRVPDMSRFFDEGIHYLGFSNLDEAIEKVVWAKEHPTEAAQIAERAYNLVTKSNFTYDARVEQILKESGFIK